MNKSNKILKRLQEHWNYAAKFYDEDRFLGIFLYGSQNYGLDTDKSDIDTKIIILPTFHDFCLETNMISKELKMDNGEHIEIKDIRLFRSMFMKQNINFIEILFTDYYIYNSKYKNLFYTYFINNREIIAHYDRGQTVKSVSAQALNTLNRAFRDHKSLYNAWRLYYFLKQYLNDDPYEKCLKPEDDTRDFLLSLRDGSSPLFSSEAEANLNRNISILNYRLQMFDYRNKEIKSPLHDQAQTILDEGVIKILKSSFHEIKKVELTKEEFMKVLSNTEFKAYYSIVKEIGAEGNITISKLIDKNSISRPVYNNLINKLKEYDIASVVNMGVKGTYIKILQPELQIEAMNFK